MSIARLEANAPTKAPLARHAKPDQLGPFTWRDKPFLAVKTVAELLDCSRARIYVLARRSDLVLVRVADRTMVRTDTLVALMQRAEAWTPGRDVRPAVEARRRARGVFRA